MGLIARGAHVSFRADTNLGGETCSVEREVHSLTLAQHAKDRTFECMRRQFVLNQIGISQNDAVTSRRIECLDDSLHD